MRNARIVFESRLGDFFTASHAPPPFAFHEALQGGPDTLFFGITTPLGGLRHGLLLHGIHARQSPHSVLLELDRCPRILTHAVLLEKFRLPDQ